MSNSYCAFGHGEWVAAGLEDYGDFAGKQTDCNQYGCEPTSGDWYYIPDEPLANGRLVIYSGTFGQDHASGADAYTYAEVYDPLDVDDMEAYQRDAKDWRSDPQFLDGNYIEPDYPEEHDLEEEITPEDWEDIGAAPPTE